MLKALPVALRKMKFAKLADSLVPERSSFPLFHIVQQSAKPLPLPGAAAACNPGRLGPSRVPVRRINYPTYPHMSPHVLTAPHSLTAYGPGTDSCELVCWSSSESVSKARLPILVKSRRVPAWSRSDACGTACLHCQGG